MDTFIQAEQEVIEQIAQSGRDGPVLMINQNRYQNGTFPDGALYQRWREVNKKMIDGVAGRIIWTLPIEGQILINGHLEKLDEILAYWYPSHQAFLDLVNVPDREENFEIRKELIDYAVIHRCSGINPPTVPSP